MARSALSLQPAAAPARVLEYLKRNPDARPAAIAIALGIESGLVYTAVSRLVKMGLYKRPRRPSRVAKPRRSALSPTASMRLAQAQFAEAAAIGPSLLPSSEPVVHPTGTPFTMVAGALCPVRGELQALGITGAPAHTSSHSHQGTANTPAAAHPWGWGHFGTKRGG